ncbi:DUF4272 domain-containing protein [Roseimaritima sediminicola]|uniref:DUF4272 domain-containing protein n=1 Tax=Roseimaritima sediminicola TaxID=2662066 RepID=UPI0012982E0E|nr:DUF4272 domain-containing protein [Roseimaritima sediminicola]
MTTLINAYGTLLAPTPVDFPCDALHHRDRSAAELSEHLNQFMGYVSAGGQREMTASLYAVLRHLQRVQHQWSFEVDADQREAVSRWAWRANAVLFYPDGSIRDPDHHVLVDPETGLPADAAQLPFPPEARQRKAQSELLLRNRLIDTPPALPPVVAESEVRLRTAEEVAQRAMALFIVAVRAESLASGQPIPVENLQARSPLAFAALSPQENQFLATDEPDQQSVMQAAWRYEALFSLQWALGLHAELPFPDTICEVPVVAETMLPRINEAFAAGAQLRETSEILDALDLHQRLLWAARQAHQNQQDPPAAIDGGVISERQHALNWLVRFEDAPWDDVDIPS